MNAASDEQLVRGLHDHGARSQMPEHDHDSCEEPSNTLTPVRKPRAYLSSAERERQIVQGAIALFARDGFAGNTRELARRLGIAHGLVFHHFRTKEDLLERVYKELFSGRWDPAWESTIQDRSLPLLDRLRTVYTSYSDRINRYEWTRIWFFAGLNGNKLNSRYWNFVREKMMLFVIEELRHEHGVPALDELPVTPQELELMWNLHASIFYIGVRLFVYQVSLPNSLEATIDQTLEFFLDGAPRVMRKVALTAATQVPRVPSVDQSI
jgi:AcrR family transcriptional regulator